MTVQNTNPKPPPPEPVCEDCPTCLGKGKVKGIPYGAIVIRDRCRPKSGAPKWSDSPKAIAYYLGILEAFVRLAIREGNIRPGLLKGKKYYRLQDIKNWYDICVRMPGIGSWFFEDMLEKTFPEIPFVWDHDLDGYTVEKEFLRKFRRPL